MKPLLTNQIGPNGRPISFVFKGNATEQDGASVYLDVEWLKRSVNFQLLEFGVVYPLFYDTLFGADSLATLDPIFPKLWRRLEKYTQDRDFRDESDTLDAFTDFLEANPDRLVIISESRATDLDNIVQIEGHAIRLPVDPEDIFFMS